ncbi:microcystin degradation protein MlrC [Dongia mobilis]|uniref:Microcystinase C n=1 Tax=Dongia mobilis TaxID=578943 RepID=A0A4R6WRY4_9PROT|nr:M81 family metallopeptidase [Dongia mobilis]TDQ82327.1 microcystin degradation protein MlrC [Dongia mobilis]
MRIVAAQMKHETNTFSPVPTPLRRFSGRSGFPLEGQAAHDAFKGTGAALAAYIDIAERAGAELVIPLAADASPSGPVAADAFKYMSDKICAAVEKGCDAIMLDLHGAMVTEEVEDGEGTLLARIRTIAPETPIAVALDMHTNLFPAMVDNATVLAGYSTYPHVDVYETGWRAGTTLMRAMKGEVTPTKAWGNRPMLPHVMRQGTHAFPNREIQARAREMEARGEALLATVFAGFPHADVYHAGLSAIVVTDNDPAKAQQLRDELLDMAWRDRAAFVYRPEPIGKSLARARELAEGAGAGPVILLDHYDNCASGGTMDTTRVLKAILDSGLDDVAAFAIHDPAAVTKMVQAGIGATVTLPIGGWNDLPSIKAKGEPLTVTGRVKLISDGRYRNQGPMERGVLQDMGATVVLDTGRVDIVILSNHVEPYDIECLMSLGIDPMRKKFIMLKSRVHFRAGFQDLAKGIVECEGVGVCTSDYSQLDFRHVRRPIYPLDPDLQ